MEIGYIYIREHESYEKYNACKIGKTLNIPERDSLYTTGEIKRGIFTLVLEVKKEELDNIEKELQITRSILKVCLKYKHPVSIITKNTLIIRDIDILTELAEMDLVHVMISVTGNDEKVRLLLEPRTSSYTKRMEVIAKLTKHGIPCGVMVAPIIPGINHHEIPKVIERASNAGATSAGITIVRLNGAVEHIFKDWLVKNFPDRASKVWNQISSCHGGKVGDSRKSVRMKGEGVVAESIMQLFQVSKTKFMQTNKEFKFQLNYFNYKAGDKQLCLF